MQDEKMAAVGLRNEVKTQNGRKGLSSRIGVIIFG
jgi:uncharacterized protein Veg